MMAHPSAPAEESAVAAPLVFLLAPAALAWQPPEVVQPAEPPPAAETPKIIETPADDAKLKIKKNCEVTICYVSQDFGGGGEEYCYCQAGDDSGNGCVGSGPMTPGQCAGGGGTLQKPRAQEEPKGQAKRLAPGTPLPKKFGDLGARTVTVDQTKREVKLAKKARFVRVRDPDGEFVYLALLDDVVIDKGKEENVPAARKRVKRSGVEVTEDFVFKPKPGDGDPKKVNAEELGPKITDADGNEIDRISRNGEDFDYVLRVRKKGGGNGGEIFRYHVRTRTELL